MSLLSPEPLPDTLYHYTDIYGLEGIYRSGELWATNALYLNDTSEVELGLNVVECQLLDQQTALHVEHLERIERGLGAPPGLDELKTLQEIVNEARRLIECYIVSFSENGDQLSQWRAYGKDGYCIGFSTAALQQALGGDFQLAKVRYHSGDASKQDADEIIELAKALWKDTARWTDDETGEFVSEELRKFAVMNLIAEESAFTKDSNFREEKEVRAVIARAGANHFTPSPRYGMTPRVKIRIPAEAVESVRVGPGAHSVLRGQSLIRFFHATPFGDDKAPPSPGPSVYKSVIPYRDW
ncbi:DUF2971 domain-containing protein [Mycobacterium sp. SMC-19]|uniref:DUF2971 domain-containing protein n=1 Tax=Mycobacterium sp. SMC-19 TaxID=3381630 RepID=UPI003876C692